MISLDENMPKSDNLNLLPKALISSSSSENNSFEFKTKSYAPIRTLDESVFSTIKRDIYMIFMKLSYVLNPKNQNDNFKELRKWDLWGPLLLCLILSVSLSIRSERQTDLLFALIFVLNWIGAFIVTINARLLGGKVSIFQSVCVLGYSVFPLCLSSVFISIMHSFLGEIFKMGIVGIGLMWTIIVSVGFMGNLVSEKKKYLAAYPTALFYCFIAWFALSV